MIWSDEYGTGIERIDDQHKMIFRMSEDFRAALDERLGERIYGSLLSSLGVYARAHFGFEEGCMERYRCPAAQKNQEAHAKFIEVLSGFHQRYAESGFDRADGQRLVDTVDQWLADHIRRVDVHLRQCVKEP